MSISGSTLSSVSGDAFTLLAAAADPKNTEIRLKQLAEATQVNQQIVEQAKDLSTKNGRERAELDKRYSDLSIQIHQHEVEVEETKISLTEREHVITAKESALSVATTAANAKLSDLSSKEVIHNQRENQLNLRDKQLTDREQEVSRREVTVKENEEKHQKRLKQLREIVG